MFFLLGNVPHNLKTLTSKVLDRQLANNFFYKHVFVFTKWGSLFQIIKSVNFGLCKICFLGYINYKFLYMIATTNIGSPGVMWRREKLGDIIVILHNMVFVAFLSSHIRINSLFYSACQTLSYIHYINEKYIQHIITVKLLILN